jgi:aminopeptidase N
MHDSLHPTIHQKDYTPPDYLIETVELSFDLEPEKTRVVSKLTVRANHDRTQGSRPLVLDGEELKLVSIKLNGEEIPPSRLQMS